MRAQHFKFNGKKTEDNKILSRIAILLNRGEIGVLPTDTLYGLVGRALDKKAVASIYRLRQRQNTKPFIILISSIRDLARFDATLAPFTAQYLSSVWPGKISAVLPCLDPDLKYLHRGTESLAFRLPDNHCLRSLIKQTGPLVAPSANLEGQAEAETIAEAQKYFGDKIGFYLDAGKKDAFPSTLIKIENDKIIILRKGAMDILAN